MRTDQPNTKKIIILALAVAIMILLFFMIQGFSRSSKIATTIEVMPKDSIVKMDGKTISSGTLYVKPGEHVFTAEKSGFNTAKSTIIIAKDNHYAGLTPDPVSADAISWAKQPQNALEIERIGGIRSENSGKDASLKNPIIDRLPYSDILGPFTVDYAFDATDSTKTHIVISNSTPNGRVKALQWIRDQGFDPANLTINFEDFNNPTNQGDY